MPERTKSMRPSRMGAKWRVATGETWRSEEEATRRWGAKGIQCKVMVVFRQTLTQAAMEALRVTPMITRRGAMRVPPTAWRRAPR